MQTTYRLLRSPEPATAPAGGESGAGGPAAAGTPIQKLASMLSEEVTPAANEPEVTPPAPAEGAPETPAAPPAEGAAGQENLPAEQPPVEGDEPKTEDEPKKAPSDPEVTKATQKRIDALTAAKYELQEKLEAAEAANAELKSQLESGNATPPASNLPDTIARLKTPGDFANAQQLHKQLKRWCERNPNGGTFSAPALGVKELSIPAEEVLNMQDYADDVLSEHLPARQAQVQQQTQFTQAQATARSEALKQFPELSDPEHADAKLVRQFLKHPGLAAEVNADYVALCMARGHRELQADLAKRKNGNGHGAAPFGKPAVKAPAGKVPLGKPTPPVGSAAPRPAPATVTLQKSLQRNGTERSIGSLAEVLSASGR